MPGFVRVVHKRNDLFVATARRFTMILEIKFAPLDVHVYIHNVPEEAAIVERLKVLETTITENTAAMNEAAAKIKEL